MRKPLLRAAPAVVVPVLLLSILLLSLGPAVAQEREEDTQPPVLKELTAADYSRASQLLSWNTENLMAGGAVRPNWIAHTDRFWYRNNSGEGFEFIAVDPARNTQGPLFDRHRLASAMSLAADTSFTGVKLPFQSFDFEEDENHIVFNANKKRFHCDIQAYSCILGDTLPDSRAFAVSPDSTVEVFIQGYDLYARPFRGGDTVRLTNDGEQYFAYGAGSQRPNQVKQKQPKRPQVAWSPDSKRLAVMRPDERGVELMHYISYTPQRPVHYAFPYALPGDSIIPQPIFHVLELPEDLSAAAAPGDSAAAHAVRNHQIVFEPDVWNLAFGGAEADSAWSSDSETLYVHYFTRGAKKLILAAVDAETGQHKVLAGDSAKTNVIGVNWTDPKSFYVSRDRGTVIWWSERDGWAHLYRYDGNDHELNQITHGPWTVGVLHHVDEARQQLYFSGRGREPNSLLYYAHLYRVNFDGTGLTLLTEEDANHEITFSPSGEFFIDVQSRIEMPPVSILRRVRDGSVVRVLEEADVSRLEGVGWRPAEVFRVKARDGITDIYGVIYFPPDLDPEKKYPVIENIYPGPFIGSVGAWSFKGGGETFALASLGFVVVQIDHMGSHYRSKAFHDNYYGKMGDNGIPDHVVGIQQLSSRYPFMDLERVGIFGHSGGGFASTDAILRFPDFYKVAVSGSGNHDNRTYGIHWGPLYEGIFKKDTIRGGDNYEKDANQSIAGNLKGKLLLMHGDMDDNVHPAMTIQVVNQLIRLNKDFDLIIAPDRAHGLNEPYFIRRRWDYFVENLMGAIPPKEYLIRRPEG